MAANDRLGQFWRAFRDSLLFVPTLMAAGALALFAVTTYVDETLAPTFARFAFLSRNPLLTFLVFSGGPQSAARLLAAIVGTWATIVGVVYSVTLVTIQLSATKYSAQVIPVFERDRLNQVTLGAFTATFAYALLVLKTVRSPDEGPGFVPVVGVNLAILFALVSLGLLLAFIGNLTAYIRPTRFVEDYAERGHKELPRLIAPAHMEGYREKRVPDEPQGRPQAVKAERSGYVSGIDWGAIRRTLEADAARVDRVDLNVALGEFVDAGDDLVLLWGELVRDETKERLEASLVIDRVPDETDPDRIAQTLGDIGVTALSGGATDVGVAKTCLRGLLSLTAEGLQQEDPGPGFELSTRDGKVLLTRKREAFHIVSYRELRRILSKARSMGYWDVAEYFALHLGPMLRSAARAEHDTWGETMAWLRQVAPDLFGYDDPRSRAYIVRRMARILKDLREHDCGDAAVDLEQVVRGAAREAGAPERELEPLAQPIPR